MQCCVDPWVGTIDIDTMAQQQLDDVVMPVAGGLVQQGLAVSVRDMEICTIDNQSLSNFFQTGGNS
jgi:hypothetical protein